MGAVFLQESLGLIHFVFGGFIIGGGLWGTLGGLAGGQKKNA